MSTYKDKYIKYKKKYFSLKYGGTNNNEEEQNIISKANKYENEGGGEEGGGEEGGGEHYF